MKLQDNNKQTNSSIDCKVCLLIFFIMFNSIGTINQLLILTIIKIDGYNYICESILLKTMSKFITIQKIIYLSCTRDFSEVLSDYIRLSLICCVVLCIPFLFIIIIFLLIYYLTYKKEKKKKDDIMFLITEVNNAKEKSKNLPKVYSYYCSNCLYQTNLNVKSCPVCKKETMNAI